MPEHASKHTLTKEVQAPQGPYSGLGVVLVASLAMFMAIASSAFVLRARAVKPSCPTYYQLPAASEWHAPERVSPRAAPSPNTRECNKPIYRVNPDDSVSVHYRVCPGGALDMDQVRSIAEQPVGLEVRRVR